jgi:glycosyltransferase involved in cell wall biosynthesis
MIKTVLKWLLISILVLDLSVHAKPFYKKAKKFCKQLLKEQMATPPQAVPEKEQKPFVVIVPSYNNAIWAEKNLRSIFEQNYDNWRLVYIDDASTDATYQRTQELVAQYHQESRVTLIRNEKNLKAVENFYRAIHNCRDEEIVIFMDGDDWFAHEGVLETLNRYYANPTTWITYGNYIDYPTYQKGGCVRKIPRKVVKNNSYRAYLKETKNWPFSHLKTCYAGLFKKIKENDLKLNGRFFEATYDQAFMLPMIEMAGDHVKLIDEILYIYNRVTPLNDDKVRSNVAQECKLYIWGLSPYEKVSTFPGQPHHQVVK